jgi:hypothetical protein
MLVGHLTVGGWVGKLKGGESLAHVDRQHVVDLVVKKEEADVELFELDAPITYRCTAKISTM